MNFFSGSSFFKTGVGKCIKSLHFPLLKKPLILACDVSPYGLGAILFHIMEDGSERPVVFASRTLSKAEQNYSQIEKEELEIIFGVTKFYQYV